MISVSKMRLVILTIAMVFLFLGGFSESQLFAQTSDKAGRLEGETVNEWQVGDWINSEPLRLFDMKSRAILVRFWTGPSCPFCRASAPSLNQFYNKYHAKGLEVIGLYHHKGKEPLNKADVEGLSREYGFEFPVAIDYDWRTLKDWWLDQGGKDWTSVTFLLDEDKKVKYVHPGGQYVEGDDDYKLMDQNIRELLETTSSIN